MSPRAHSAGRPRAGLRHPRGARFRAQTTIYRRESGARSWCAGCCASPLWACRGSAILYAKKYQVKRWVGGVALRHWLGEAKAKRVYLILRDRILSAAVGFGAKLPNENELARYHGVSRVTVRRALGELARERLIER